MNTIYNYLLSIRDFVSFLTGIIVSGYVVEISVNSENTYWHWGAVLCGLLFGFLSYILIKISKNFDDNITANKINNPTNTKIQNEQTAWESVSNKLLPLNKIFGCFPQFWMPIITPLMPTLFILGIWLLHIGNQKNYQRDEIRNEEEQTELIRKIDSINRQNIKSYEVEKNLYQDSLHSTEIKLNIQAKQIDSLENIIRSLKGINKKTEPQKKKPK